MSYPHAPGTLARKLRDELPTVVPDGTGRPGFVRVRRFDRWRVGQGYMFGPSFHRDSPLGAVEPRDAVDPQHLLTSPDSSD